ncbi:hypothetical protein CHRY9390_00515 [Chryseobacterium aquaeductus]|uniref:Yip1 domain-containing protein n=1 Tax=Chryseobacterium aquaeductus TaxID=2675056 RepID=A0A9N8MEU9_9FLAO|nr:YIP1 family protein [Chryseobacterium aquaeductus]CAA7329867.1 hypothetical protein CHRY9390_00515 [Chryseobacterium potabilaquae]CAD7799639.1 hypothetical protein CHRY9390_00515 [Chryseobacterium aquaeductus]
MTWKTIFNPFSKFSELQLLILGIIFMVVNFLVCYHFGLQMDSIFHFGYINPDHSILQIIWVTLRSYLIGLIVLFILGKIYNRKTRFIDIINTVLISQIPGLVIVIIGEIPFVENALEYTVTNTKNLNNTTPVDLTILCFYIFINLLVAAYGMTLLYNGFKTATNIKNWKQIVLFAFVVIVTVTASQFLI